MYVHADGSSNLSRTAGGKREGRRTATSRGVPALATLLAALLLSALAGPVGAAGPFTLSSLAFVDGGPIPASAMWNGGDCRGLNILPTLTWSNAPAGTQSFALILFDPDSGQAIPSGWVHWIVYNIPATVSALDTNNAGQYTQGATSFSALGAAKPGYGGPCPPANGLVHHYTFTLYALDVPRIAGDELNREALYQAMNKHVLASTSVVGLFARQPSGSAPAAPVPPGVIQRLGVV